MTGTAFDDATPVERLVMEARIYSARQHLAEIAGEDVLGIEFYQRSRMDAAAQEVAEALEVKP